MFTGKSVDYGLLPESIYQTGFNSKIKHVTLSEAIAGSNFDVALLPEHDANLLRREGYLHYRVNPRNEYVLIQTGKNNKSLGVCDLNVTADICLPLREAYRRFVLQEGKVNFLTYGSIYNQINSSIRVSHKAKRLNPFQYQLVVRDGALSPYQTQAMLRSINKPKFQMVSYLWWLLLVAVASAAVVAVVAIRSTRIDTQSGCLNKRAWEDDSYRELDKFTALLIDFNNFKRVNDELGHKVGDQLIEHVGEMLVESMRTTDNVYRIGGDEFVIAAFNTIPQKRLTEIVETLKKSAVEIGKPLGAGKVDFGLSIGTVTTERASLQSVYADLDMAMYHDKRRTRTQAIEIQDATV
ncbi:GGDEF domain-containing protein [Vibrio agarivorans]|uniref:diguanylate cyclase n=1 Tax=Vibrio agarivorans TaxID=153622 RepID=A0ABT7Y863_9VIBR|nr:GGDEF domain-containing protein [Vibrio agarivorans]MDN2483949.1 GGDEF domain-containing protein [Vibrio agarivorans]